MLSQVMQVFARSQFSGGSFAPSVWCFGVRGFVTAVERIWHIYDSQDQIGLDFRVKALETISSRFLFLGSGPYGPHRLSTPHVLAAAQGCWGGYLIWHVT